MKSGHLLGGLAAGVLIGAGIGYLLGVDAEKRNQWIKTIGDKFTRKACTCGCGCDNCDCGEEPKAEVAE